MKLLYVEDEKHLALALEKILKKQHYSVDLAHDGETGLDLALSGIYDIVILDVMLPKRSGTSIVRAMRAHGLDTPVILLTAKTETRDKVEGLDSGADDYLAKPFESEELMARLRALARRKSQVETGNEMGFADIKYNYNSLDLSAHGKTFHLTPKEGQLLELLLNHRGQLLSNEQIIEKLWGWDSDAQASHVQVQLAFLRKKLRLISSRVQIKTVYGAGYMLEDDDV